MLSASPSSGSVDVEPLNVAGFPKIVEPSVRSLVILAVGAQLPSTRHWSEASIDERKLYPVDRSILATDVRYVCQSELGLVTLGMFTAITVVLGGNVPSALIPRPAG